MAGLVHAQAPIVGIDGDDLLVDEGMRTLLAHLWRDGIRTRWSCEGTPGLPPADGGAYLMLDGEDALRRFLVGVTRTPLAAVVETMVELPRDFGLGDTLPWGSTWIVIRGFCADDQGIGVYFTHADRVVLDATWQRESKWRLRSLLR